MQAIADRAFALAAATEFEGPRRNIERVGVQIPTKSPADSEMMSPGDTR
ncbi:MAG TPA: hypothetical protein VF917_09965 [Steroidobacteraceae bacterium]